MVVLAALVAVPVLVGGGLLPTPAAAFAHCLTDTDGDGVCDEFETGDTDDDLTPDVSDPDDDGDGIDTRWERADPDGDGHPTDAVDTDGDGIPDYLDDDDDDDGVLTAAEGADPNGDGDDRDALDSDLDGQPDHLDPPLLAAELVADTSTKISDLTGGLGASPLDGFGAGVAAIGDVDGDGITDLAVGEPGHPGVGGSNRGAVHILFLDADGTVRAEQEISDGLGVTLANGDRFGASLAGVGDLDGDGVAELAVGADQADVGGPSNGAVHILFLDPDGTVRAEQIIAEGTGGLAEDLNDNSRFGFALGSVGDLDDDGVNDLAVGAVGDSTNGPFTGAVYLLFLNADGTVGSEQKITHGTGGLTATISADDSLAAVAGIGDLDGDGVEDIVVGAYSADDGGNDRGRLHVLFLDTDGTVRAEQTISDLEGGLTAALDDSDFFGVALAAPGDVDGDGLPDVAVGATWDDDAGGNAGAVYLLGLAADGTVRAEQKFTDGVGGFTGDLDGGDLLGGALTGLGDLDGDGAVDLAVGAVGDDDGLSQSGAVHLFDLTPAALTVNSTGDASDLLAGDGICDTGALNVAGATECTLRAAIEETNAGAVGVVEFAIPDDDPNHRYFRDDATPVSIGIETTTSLPDGAIVDFDADHPNGGFSWWAIEPATDLPAITAPTRLDGSTQPGWQPTTTVDGSPLTTRLPIRVVGPNAGSTLRLMGSGAEIRSLNLDSVSSSGTALLLGGGGRHVVQDTWLMVDPVGFTYGSGDLGLLVLGGSDDNVVGGARPADLVLVGNGFGGTGVELDGDRAVVANLWIGVSASGEVFDGYNDIALDLRGDDNVVGAPGAGVVVASSLNLQMVVDGDRNVIEASRFGEAPDGTPAPENRRDVVQIAGSDNRFGGTTPGSGNRVVADDSNGSAALSIVGGRGNSVLGSSLVDGLRPGLDHNDDGVTVNDPGDGDVGPNDLLNHPVIVTAVPNATDLDVDLALDVPAGTYRIELFADTSRAPSPTGHGASESLLGATTVVSAGIGLQTFSMTVPDPGPAYLSATATVDLGAGAFGSTSEFGPTRRAPTTAVVVNSTGTAADANPGDGICDTGVLNVSGETECTLPAAEAETDASAGIDLVHFDIPTGDPGHSGGVWTIQLTAPVLIDTTSTYDATTQPGFTTTPVIHLDGSNAPASDMMRIRTGANGVTIRGFAIDGYSGSLANGIEIDGDDAVIVGNHVGVDPTGFAPVGVGDAAVLVDEGDRATIGGSDPADRNIIGGWSAVIVQSGAIDTTIAGNHIGVAIDGTTAIAGTGDGVRIQEGARRTVVGGPTIAHGNVIGGWSNNAVRIDDVGTDDTIVRWNAIGMSADGATAIPTTVSSIRISGGPTGVTIADNAIGNGLVGIELDGTSADVRIDGNAIGVNRAGDVAHPLVENGVLAENGPTGVVIGELAPNTITNSGAGGTFLDAINVLDAGTEVAAVGNRITGNPGLAIDLGGDGVTSNDPGDGDTGPNGLLNHPVLRSATDLGAGSVDLEFDLDVPASRYRLDVYTNPSGPDASGSGEGEDPTDVVFFDHPGGPLTRTETISASLGDVLTATLTTNPVGDIGVTSEFSGAVVVPAANTDPIAVAAPVGPIAEGDDVTLDGSGSSDPDTDPLTHTWDLDGDGNHDDAAGPNPLVTWADLQMAGRGDDGTHTIGLRVDDGAGGSDTTTVDLVVTDTPPTIAVTAPSTTTVGQTVTITVASTDPGDDTVTGWSVAWGDGTITDHAGSGGIATHTYTAAAGVRGVTVAVTNDDGTFVDTDLLVPLHDQTTVLRLDIDTAGVADTIGVGHGLSSPYAAVVALDGRILVSDFGNDRVLRFDDDGTFVDVFVPTGVAQPKGLAIAPDGDLLVASSGTGAVVRFDGVNGANLGPVVTLNAPAALHIGPDGELYVTDQTTELVSRVDLATDSVEWSAGTGAPAAMPVALEIAPTGELLVARWDDSSVVRLDRSDGSLLGVLVADGAAGTGSPNGLTVLPDGRLVVSDYQNDELETFDVDSGLHLARLAELDPLAGGASGPFHHAVVPHRRILVENSPGAIVNDAGDGGDLTPGDGLCDTGALNVAGDPACTLRAAIEETNASAVLDTILFAIPVADAGHDTGTWRIRPATALPDITATVTIDGTSQPGHVDRPVIEVDGDRLGSHSGLVLRAGAIDSEIRALAIGEFNARAVQIQADRVRLIGNHFGLSADGTTPMPVGGTLVWVDAGDDAVIGGTTPGEGNVFVGAPGSIALLIQDGGPAVVFGNEFGRTGLLAAERIGTAIQIDGGSSDIVIGGTAPGEANTIVDTTGDAIIITGAGSSRNTVEGNLIGLQQDGTTPGVIGGSGISVRQPAVTTTLSSNTIANTAGHGIEIDGADDVVVTGQRIGLDAGAGAHPVSGHGVLVRSGASAVVIGGPGPLDGNLIRDVGQDGVAVVDAATDGVVVLGNSIRGSGGLGIDLGDDGVTPNDAGDADTGPNTLLNTPQPIRAIHDGGTTTLDVDLDLVAGDARLEVFANPTGLDPSGSGEGDVLLAAVTVSHTGAGVESFDVTVPALPGERLTVTVTQLTGGGAPIRTSEFSSGVTVVDSVVVVNATGDSDDAAAGDGRCDTGALNSAGATECTLRAALTHAAATPGVDRIEFQMPATEAGHAAGTWTISPGTDLPRVTRTVVIDGTSQPGATVTTTVSPAPIDGRPAVEIVPSVRASVFDIDADDVVVRGLAIAGHDGLEIRGDRVRIVGSFLGLRADGRTTETGWNNVVTVFGSAFELGGAAPADRAVVAGHGAALYLPGSRGVVRGSFIGLDVDGTPVTGGLGDRAILLRGSDHLVGGVGVGEGNVVAGATVAISIDGGTANSILGNHLLADGGAAIDRSGFNDPDGLDPNDPGDLDTGVNDGINHPVVTSATASAGTVRVELAVDLQPGPHRIEVFANPSGASASGSGPGEEFRGALSVNVTGATTIEVPVPGTPGEVFSATVTRELAGGSYGSTSELSPAVTAIVPPSLVVNDTGDAVDLVPGDGACDTGALNTAGAPACTLRAALQEAAGGGSVSILFDLPTTEPGRTPWGWAITPATTLPVVPDAVSVDGSSQPGAGPGAPVVGLELGTGAVLELGSSTTVRGLAIVGGTSESLLIDGRSSVVVSDLVVGGRPDGSRPASAAAGIRIRSSADVRVGDAGGHVVVHGRSTGVVVDGASGAVQLDGLVVGSDPTSRPQVALDVDGTGADVVVIDAEAFATATIVSADGTTSVQVLGGRLGVRGDGGTEPTAEVVVAVAGAASATIGGTGPGEGVMLGGHGRAGIVHRSTGTVAVRRSSIEARPGGAAAAPIDLGDDGPTANDPGDGDGGPNGRLNHPELDVVELDGVLTVAVTMDAPAGAYEVEVWRAGEGNHPRTLLGVVNLLLTAGPETVELTAPGAVGDRLVAVATATGAPPTSSEVSPVATATPGNQAPTVVAATASTTAEGGAAVVRADVVDPDGDPLTVRWDLDGDGGYDDADGPVVALDWSDLVALGIDDDGSRPIGVRVDDGRTVVTASTTLIVLDTPPELSWSGPVEIAVDREATFGLRAVDPGRDPIVAWDVEGLGNGVERRSDVGADGGLEVRGAWASTGRRTLRAWAIDADGLRTGPVEFVVTVTPGPTGDPVADRYQTPEDRTLVVPAPGVLANDPLGTGPVALPGDVDEIVTTAGRFVLAPDGSFEYVPSPNWSGEARFSYETAEGRAVTVVITVTAVNDPADLTVDRAPRDPETGLRSIEILDVDDGDYEMILEPTGVTIGWAPTPGVEVVEGADGSVTATGSREALERWIATLTSLEDTDGEASVVVTLTESTPDGDRLPPRRAIIEIAGGAQDTSSAELLDGIIVLPGSPDEEPPDALAAVAIETGTLRELPSVTRALAVAILELISDPAVPRRTLSAGTAWFLGITWFVVWRRRLRPVLRVVDVVPGETLEVTARPGSGPVVFELRHDAETLRSTGRRRRRRALVEIETTNGAGWVPKANVERMRLASSGGERLSTGS